MNAETISFAPPGPPRPGTIYINYDLLQMLKYAAKREGCTRDDLFEREMMLYLVEKHPDIVKWVQERAESQKEFEKGLVKK